MDNENPIQIKFYPERTTWPFIHGLLSAARETGKEGPVAQHLIGAKLELRFPNIVVSNESYSTADDQLGRKGDFSLGDTVFHVTVAPMPALYDKCRSNVNEGYRVYILVPDRCLAATRQNTELTTPGQIAVESIESFVSQNIEELSLFQKDKLITGLCNLLHTYNRRVDASEIDKSLLIEIPQNLE